MDSADNKARLQIIGLITLPIRLVSAWLFLAAALRRIVLKPGAHDMDSTEWIGHKINTFMPHANGGFHGVLEWLCRSPDYMNVFSYVLTYSELLVGILLALGFLGRLAGLALLSLSVGLMHTSGWLGPTCLDEWQIASLLTANSLALILFGSGSFSLDSYLTRRKSAVSTWKVWGLLTGSTLPNLNAKFTKVALACAVAVTLYVILMNQVHHGGVWGPLHNKSTQPNIVVDGAFIESGSTLHFNLYRDEGPETSGDFITELCVVRNGSNEKVLVLKYDELARHVVAVENSYLNKVAIKKDHLLVPLGAKARISITLPHDLAERGGHMLILTNIAGRDFPAEIR